MTVRIIILSVLIVAFIAASSEAGWLIFHEPEFNGKVIDIDTKEPIEGVVVVVEYNKKTMGIGASMSSIMDVRETLTDKEGNFHLPSYTALIQPFSWQIPTGVIIYKPGYASLVLGTGYFTGEVTKEQGGSWPQYPAFSGLKYRLRGPGIVELPKLKTKEQRLTAKYPADIFGAEIGAKELPLLYKIISEENKALGLK